MSKSRSQPLFFLHVAAPLMGLWAFEIGFDWVCIGFVFTKCPIGFIFIIRCIYRVCNPPTADKIGFVLHKKIDL